MENNMKKKVYIETSIIGHLATVLTQRQAMANQRDAREWWSRVRPQCDLYISSTVLDELADGRSEEADKRLGYVDGLRPLHATEESDRLLTLLVRHKVVPEDKPADAGHIAIAAICGMEVLLTLNQKHIANAHQMARMNGLILSAGYQPPAIVRPGDFLSEKQLSRLLHG